MASLTSKVEVRSIICPGFELHPDVKQFLYTVRAVFNHHADHLFLAQTGPGEQRIINMQIKGIICREHCSYATLRKVAHEAPGQLWRLYQQVLPNARLARADESAAITGHSLVADRGAAAYNPISVPGRLEAGIRELLEAQGSEWIKGEG